MAKVALCLWKKSSRAAARSRRHHSLEGPYGLMCRTCGLSHHDSTDKSSSTFLKMQASATSSAVGLPPSPTAAMSCNCCAENISDSAVVRFSLPVARYSITQAFVLRMSRSFGGAAKNQLRALWTSRTRRFLACSAALTSSGGTWKKVRSFGFPLSNSCIGFTRNVEASSQTPPYLAKIAKRTALTLCLKSSCSNFCGKSTGFTHFHIVVTLSTRMS
mmetsp:Transcript_17112/g.48873  ORF Transcript_17112/g.48873 Transcript_17112/m.48873 type:complete len:217 (-) Transcript_17112:247-897(-)